MFQVLFDENNFSADDLHQMCHSLAFTFARATRSVFRPTRSPIAAPTDDLSSHACLSPGACPSLLPPTTQTSVSSVGIDAAFAMLTRRLVSVCLAACGKARTMIACDIANNPAIAQPVYPPDRFQQLVVSPRWLVSRARGQPLTDADFCRLVISQLDRAPQLPPVRCTISETCLSKILWLISSLWPRSHSQMWFI